jgi:hypothetical protein
MVGARLRRPRARAAAHAPKAAAARSRG